MSQEEQVRLCEELELLFDYTEGRITLEEYQTKIKLLEAEREELLRGAGMLAE